jgi:two-component system sensor histidine kinase BaeS
LSDLPRRITVYDSGGGLVCGDGSLTQDPVHFELLSHNTRVGWVSLRPFERFNDALDVQYIQAIRWQIATVTVVAFALALGVGALLARRIIRPIRALTAATGELIAGSYERKLAVNDSDELGDLARHFDRLAQTLKQDALARKQWVADTSHELRTPLTVLRAELEALSDGVRPLTRDAVGSLQSELKRLEDIVRDIDELARSDRGALVLELVPLNPVECIEQCLKSHESRLRAQRIATTVRWPKEPVWIVADRSRLAQICANLLENTARYTDRGGQLRVSVSAENSRVIIRFEDSAPGVSAQALPHLFERFFREDASRSRAHGGSGLGLAICEQLAHAQSATITAEKSELGGLCITLCFARAERPLFAPSTPK